MAKRTPRPSAAWLRRSAALWAALALAACRSHDVVEIHAVVEQVATAPSGDRTAAFRRYVALQWRAGLGFLASGDIPEILDEGMEIYFCEKSTREFRRLAVIPNLAAPSDEFPRARVVGWDARGVVFGLFGYASTTGEAGGTLWIRANVNGTIDTLRAPPIAQQAVDRVALPDCKPALDALHDLIETPVGPQTDTVVFMEMTPTLRTARRLP